MDSPDLFSSAYAYFATQLDIFLNARYSSVVSEVRGPLLSGLLIYIAVYAFAIMRGVVQEPLTDFVYRGVKLAILFSAATTVAYQDWITDPLFHGAPTAITQAVAGKSYTSMGSVFDGLEAQSLVIADRLQTEAGAVTWTSPGKSIQLYLISLVVQLFAEIAAVIGFGVSMLALISLAIIIAMGPIFIALSLFDWGKRYFNGWLNQAFNYIVLLAIITTMATLVTDMGEVVLQKAGTDDSVGIAMFYTAFFALAAFFFLQAPAIASGIAGGASAGASDLIGNVARAAGQRWLPQSKSGGRGGGGGGRGGKAGGSVSKT